MAQHKHLGLAWDHETFKELRERKGLSRYFLAHEIHVAQRNVLNWETGHCSPGVEAAVAICRVLGVKVEDLVVEI